MSRLRGPSAKGVYVLVFVVSGLAVVYLPRAWVPSWLRWAVYLEMAFVVGAFLFQLRSDRLEAEAAREAELRAREANPLKHSHQPSRAPAE